MRKIIITVLLVVLVISCNKDEDCVCKKYRVTSNGSLLLEGETSMQNCEGANPTPQLVAYKKECN